MKAPLPTVHEVTIAASGTTSEAFDTDGEIICGVIFPSSMTGTGITFMAVVDEEDYDIYETTGEQTPITKVNDAYVPLFTDSWRGISSFKVKSDATEASAVTLKILTRPIG